MIKQKNGLRKGQVRILSYLLANKGVLSPEWRIVQEAPVDHVWVSNLLYGRVVDLTVGAYITQVTPAGLECEEAQGYRCLLGLGYVKGMIVYTDDGKERCWEITEAGERAIKEVLKAQEQVI